MKVNWVHSTWGEWPLGLRCYAGSKNLLLPVSFLLKNVDKNSIISYTSITYINDIQEVNSNRSNLKQNQTVLVICSYDRWKDRLEDQTVKSLEKKLGKIWWTKENGAVIIESDGERLKIKPIISED